MSASWELAQEVRAIGSKDTRRETKRCIQAHLGSHLRVGLLRLLRDLVRTHSHTRLFALILVTSCAGDPAGRPATWSYLHAAVIAPNCATSSCHSSVAKTAGLTLDDPEEAYLQLLGRNFVVPGDPASTLLSLLNGDERRRMPPDAPLPAADVALVKLWIEAGAPE